MKSILMAITVFAGLSCFAAFDTNNLARVTAAINEAGDSCPILERFNAANKIEGYYNGKYKASAIKSGKIIDGMCVELLNLVARERKRADDKDAVIETYKTAGKLNDLANEKTDKMIENLRKQIAVQKETIEILKRAQK